jgi:putative transposase
VELNPVRAGLVRRAWDWSWSSAGVHVSGEAPDKLLDLAWWRTRYDARNWREILEFGVEEVELRERLREATRTGRPFGTTELIDGLEAQLWSLALD